jgi:DNA-binding transcriptional regulator GbsR (MarR family)
MYLDVMNLVKHNDERLENIHKKIIDRIGSNMKLYGYSETVGRLMGTIFYNREPMTLDEMKEELGMSKMRMSSAVRELTDVGLAEKVYEKGVRKDLYVVEQEYYQTFISLFCANWRKGISMNHATQQKIIPELEEIINDEKTDDETRIKAREYLDETKKVLAYYDWLSRLLDVFESHEIFEYVPKTEDDPS